MLDLVDLHDQVGRFHRTAGRGAVEPVQGIAEVLVDTTTEVANFFRINIEL